MNRFLRIAAAIPCCALLSAGLHTPLAHADTVAQDLITILEASGQLSPEQAKALRAKAEQERKDLETTIRDEVQLNADILTDDAYMEFDEVGAAADDVVTSKLSENVQVGGYMQVLKSFGVDDEQGAFDTSDLTSTDGFRIRRARLAFTGNVSDRTNWKFQIDADTPKDVIDINEVWLEHQPAMFDDGALDGTKVRVGLQGARLSRERMFSSSQRTTIGRAITHDTFLPDRQVGVTFRNTSLLDGTGGFWLGFMNGGANEDTINGNNGYLVYSRMQYAMEPREDMETTFGIWGFYDDLTGDTTDLFELAIAGTEQDIAADGNRAAIGFDAAVEMGRWFFDVNFLYGFAEGNTAGPAAAGSSVVIQTNDDLNLVGEAEFWTINVRKAVFLDEDNKWQLVGMFEYGDFDEFVNEMDYWATTFGLNYYGLTKYRSVVRLNWVHLEQRHGAFGAVGASNTALDYLLAQWQVKY